LSSDPVLELRGVTKRYGALTVSDHVDFSVGAGERHALIGPNGAGKTTLFNLIAGRVPTTEGRILLKGEEITRMREEARARRGIGRTFQHSELFGSLDPLQNVVMALRRRRGAPAPLLPLRRRDRAMAEEAGAILEQVGLAPETADRVSDLAHGQRRQLEVAMALAQEPDVLLFDEPTAGMSTAESAIFCDVFAALPRDLAVVLIEHDLDVVFSLAEYVTVLSAGAVIAQGDPTTIQRSDEVQDAYLGTELEEVFL
jgi:branched-chain amino acid transport system ATP-binding protein